MTAHRRRRARRAVRGGIGERLPRSDGRAKVTGSSPTRPTCARTTCCRRDGAQPARLGAHPRHRHRRGARACPACARCSRTRTCRAHKLVGAGHHKDQPVLAFDRVRYHGEPVAVVAAEDLATARRAAALIAVDYEPLPVLVDAEAALAPDAPAAAPARQRGAQVRIVHGDPGRGRTGRDPRQLRGRHAGPGLPRPRGRARPAARGRRRGARGRDPVAAPGPRAGRGGARPAGGAACGSCSPASAAPSAGARTSRCTCTPACSRSPPGRPVKMVYGRDESFVGHVHRHPARLDYEHVAPPRTGASSAFAPACCSTAAPTRRARRP